MQLNPTDAASLNALEERLEYERIVLFRSLAEAYLEKEKEFKEREKKKLIESQKATGAAPTSGSSFWNWWTGSTTNSAPDLELTETVWKELYAAIDDEYLSASQSSDQVRIPLNQHVSYLTNYSGDDVL